MNEFPQSLIPVPTTLNSVCCSSSETKSRSSKESDDLDIDPPADATQNSSDVKVDHQSASKQATVKVVSSPEPKPSDPKLNESIEVDISIQEETHKEEEKVVADPTSSLPFDKNVTVDYLTGAYTLKELKGFLSTLGVSNVSGKKADMAQRILTRMQS